MKRHFLTLSLLIAIGVVATHTGQVRAEERGELDCKLKFSLSSWSVIYKHSEGNGVVTCENGETINVKITAHGGGLTVGKSRIEGGAGRFSDVHKISDVLGHYGQAGAHAGASKSSMAQVLTKGKVSLALAGTGKGVDLGVDVGELTLTRVK